MLMGRQTSTIIRTGIRSWDSPGYTQAKTVVSSGSAGTPRHNTLPSSVVTVWWRCLIRYLDEIPVIWLEEGERSARGEEREVMEASLR